MSDCHASYRRSDKLNYPACYPHVRRVKFYSDRRTHFFGVFECAAYLAVISCPTQFSKKRNNLVRPLISCSLLYTRCSSLHKNQQCIVICLRMCSFVKSVFCVSVCYVCGIQHKLNVDKFNYNTSTNILQHYLSITVNSTNLLRYIYLYMPLVAIFKPSTHITITVTTATLFARSG